MLQNVAAYCRVSTDNTDQLHSLSAQMKYFTEYIGEQDGWRLTEVYYDEGISALNTRKRDSFNRMIADAENGKIDLILTKEVSRFARNTVDTLSFTRRLSSANVGVIFTNDNLDTRDKDGELRLTIMASIAQEESRKTSERVKWSLRRKMEDGVVLGCKKMFGYRTIDGVMTVVPEEAEIVRRAFNAYAYENKGFQAISQELNDEGFLTLTGNPWTKNAVQQMLRHDKYVGDLTQAKRYVADFLNKEYKFNKKENYIHIPNHHEAIIDRETWNITQSKRSARACMKKEGRKHSSINWFSAKTKCGICGSPYNANMHGYNEKFRNDGTEKRPTLYCTNRRSHGNTARTSINGIKIGCPSIGVNENVLIRGMAYILEHIQSTRTEIVNDLLEEIKTMQQEVDVIDTVKLEQEITNNETKKRNVIDLMLEGLISKDDLKKQTAFYESEIARLKEEIYKSRNINYVHEAQIDTVKEYIKKVKSASKITDYDNIIFGELLKTVVMNNDEIDFYLNCVPFGFRIKYHTTGGTRKWQAHIDSCAIIE